VLSVGTQGTLGKGRMHLRTLGWAVKPAGATKAEAEATAAKARALESCEVGGDVLRL
jgi:hypothetical protein